MVLFLNYYSSTLLEFHRKVTVIYLNFQPYKRRKKHVRVFGKSRTCFSENTYVFFQADNHSPKRPFRLFIFIFLIKMRQIVFQYFIILRLFLIWLKVAQSFVETF
ncbi:hypothetical protein D7V78_06195 [Parabacteroides distasonis]|uniref:Uncharacterized protein n=1 Tax=Parabacteroides distasonis TaxID=823 RepID=A0A3L7ZVC1_PARDI|nr:hypothetical protein [Parabacteroides distasonis]RLT74233.1 hypothetical protein D7V78_06195 [Parabacteroides distasonis]